MNRLWVAFVRSSILVAFLAGSVGCLAGGSEFKQNRQMKMSAEDYFPNGLQADLAEAVAKGNAEAINKAVASGADPNFIGEEGMTPLLWAITNQNPESVRKLLELGADANLSSRIHPNPGGNINPLRLASELNDAGYLATLLDNGGNPNLVEEDSGQTPIFSAVLRRQPKNILMLLEAGAEIDHKDKAGVTPIHFAVLSNIFDMALLLLKHGADPSIKNRWGDDALTSIELYGARGVDRDTENYSAYRSLVEELRRQRLLN